jgi:transcriptional regulator with XRE-family HTH domain
VRVETQEIGKRLRELREQAGKTQADLAYESGVSLSTVVRYEGGDSGMKLLPLDALAQELGVKVHDLMLRERDSNAQPTGSKPLTSVPEILAAYPKDSSSTPAVPMMPIEAA